MKSLGRRNSICLFTAIFLVYPRSSSIFKPIFIWQRSEWTVLSFGWRKVERSPGKSFMLSGRGWTEPTQDKLSEQRQFRAAQSWRSHPQATGGNLEGARRAGQRSPSPASASILWTLFTLGGAPAKRGSLLNGFEYRLWNQTWPWTLILSPTGCVTPKTLLHFSVSQIPVC